MPALLHPWLSQARIAAARGGGWRRNRGAIALLASSILLPLGLRLSGSEAAMLPAAVPRLIAQLPLPFALLALALAYALARGRLIALDERLRHGWWAAAPIAPAATVRTLIVLAFAATLLAMLISAVMLIAFGGEPVQVRSACGIVAGGLGIGASFGLISALRHRRHPRHRLREGARLPLFGLRWLDDARLPHLSDWQRRDALLRWRRGGHAWMVGAVLAALPSSTAIAAGLGVLLIAVAIAWFSLVVRGCVAATVAADRLLASTPRAPRAFARAAWRYPAFAFVCAATLMLIGGALLSLNWRAAPVLLAIVLVLSLPALSGLRRVHRPVSPR
ncbi:MAG: hypothetical protein JF591_08720 [Lysobacter sp.]|nr:hypothetical protein [Lysobacter sp.]